MAKIHELVQRKMILRQGLLDLEEEIRDARREIKRTKPSWWQKVKSDLKRLWSKLFYWKVKKTKPFFDETEREALLISPPRPSKVVTLAIDTPTPKKVVRPTPSFADNLSISSIETLTESPEPSSFLQRFTSLRNSQRRVAPSTSWVEDVLGSSVISSSSLTSDLSTLEIPDLASDDLDTSLTRGQSSEDLYLYCYRS